MRLVIRALAALALGSLLLAPAWAADSTAQKLVGLWASENDYGPAVKGTLTLDGRQAEWRASIAGFEVAAKHTGDAVSFTLPGGQGEFRGTLQAGGKEIRGEWIQPPGITNNNPYATPVTLNRGAEQVWQGQVSPLPDELSLYVLITQQPDGTLSAAIRNPEFNFGHRAPYAVTVDGNRATLTNPRNASDKMQADYDADGDSLSIHVAAINTTLDFTRRDRDHALGFYPVTPAQAAFSYRPPVVEDDGWTTGNLKDAGLDPKPIQALLDSLVTASYAGPHTPYIHSLLVARHSKLVLEQYFYGYDQDSAHSTRSAGKTFAGVLLGIALDQGAKFNMQTPVVSLFPEYKDMANLDARKRAMTVRDLATMTSGLNCDDNDDGNPGNEDNMQQQSKQPDWYRYTLDVPMARDPGGDKAVYCSAGVNLLGGVVRNATGTELPEFFEQNYARPLDIRHYHMNLMPTGAGYMGGGIMMTARDQLKLGQLYLNGGTWNGKRVVSAGWVKASWQAQSVFEPGHSYGYTWHIIDLKSGDKTYRLYEAGGNGGQFVIAIPELDMVVGFTAGNYGDFPVWYKFMTDLIPKYVIPAAGG